MIIKIFEGHGSSGSECIEYLLGKEGDRPRAKVLFGNPLLTANLIDHLKFEKKFTAGCLALTETDLPKKSIDEVIRYFQFTLCEGLLPNQLNFLWVEHRDKNNLELNFVIPHVDLLSGKLLTAFFNRLDGKLIRSFQGHMNAFFGLSSPDSPFYILKLTVDRLASDAQQKFQQGIHEELLRKIDLGKIHREEDLLGFLAGYSLELTKRNKHSMCFRHTSTKQKYFFRGALYSQDFDFSPLNLMESIQLSAWDMHCRGDEIANRYFSDAYDCCMRRKKRFSRYEPSPEYRHRIQVPGYDEWLALREFSFAHISSPTPTPTPTPTPLAELEIAPSSEAFDENLKYREDKEHEFNCEDYDQPEDDYDFSP